MIAWQHPAALA